MQPRLIYEDRVYARQLKECADIFDYDGKGDTAGPINPQDPFSSNDFGGEHHFVNPEVNTRSGKFNNKSNAVYS